MAKKDDDSSSEKDEAKKGGKKNLIILVLGALLLGAGGVGGTLYFLGILGGGSAEEGVETEEVVVAAEPIYFAFPQPFTVNFETPKGVRFLQVGLELMTHDQASLDALQVHMPVITNNIILLLSSQPYDTLISREGKDKVRADLLSTIQEVLKKYHGEPGIEEIYFTSFVMQ